MLKCACKCNEGEKKGGGVYVLTKQTFFFYEWTENINWETPEEKCCQFSVKQI